MWNWLDVFNGLFTSIKTSIQNVVSLISDGVIGAINSIKTAVDTVFTAIVELPGNIVTLFGELLHDIFIPDAEYIDNSFNSFLDDLKFKFNFDTGFFENLFDNEKPVTDVTTDYTIPGVGSFNLKILDTKYLVDGVEYFRPFIRGFLVLLMALYHIRQLIGFFGYDAGVVAGRNEHIKSAREEQ